MNNNSPDKLPQKRLKIFNSFEEAAELERLHVQHLSPEERLANVVILIKKIYNHKPKKYYRIFFDKV